MKSFNVKSNAKRFARQLVAKFPDYIAVEPVEVAGSREWFPNVAAPTKIITAGIPEEIASTAYVNGQLAATTAERVGGHEVIKGGETGEPEAVTITKPAAVGKSEMSLSGQAAMMTVDAMKEAVATLPKTRSTPEEIEARRQARRERVVTEPKAPKLNKATTIVALVSRPDGATIDEIMAATDWQAHTVRGFISGTLNKRGHNIISVRAKGEKTRYTLGAAQ